MVLWDVGKTAQLINCIVKVQNPARGPPCSRVTVNFYVSIVALLSSSV